MATLYVTEIGTQVRKVGERLVICKGQDVLEEIPLIHVDQVVLMGRSVSLTTAAMFALTQKGADIVYLSGTGRFISRMIGGEHKHSRLRFAQAQMVSNPGPALDLARSIVAGKINNQRVLVQRHAEQASWAKGALDGMGAMLMRVGQASTVDELRGLEGQAAKEYFGLYRQLLRRPADGLSWGFERRAYYPPTDPINAMLSFGYTLLLNDLTTACQLAGLDPYLGCFHVIDYGRPSLALDLVEEFRPVLVDSLVLYAVNRSLVQLKDFQVHQPEAEADEDDLEAGHVRPEPAENRPQAVYLAGEARQRFLTWYQERANAPVQAPVSGERTTLKRVFSLQAQQVARLVLGEGSRYQPFTIR